jgi:AcrR family transcriptional regulator
MPVTGSEIPRQRRKDARPGELIAAALDLFVERGYAATRLDDVAARAGVTKGTLYLYFENKEALFKSVIEQSIVPVLEEAEQMVEAHRGPTAELLSCLMRGWWQQVGATRLGGIPKLVISEAQNFPEVARYYHEAVIKRAHVFMGRVLTRGIASGEFRPVDADYAFQVIFSPIIMLMIWRHSFTPCCGEGVDPERFIDIAIDMALNGLQQRTDRT